MSATDRDDGPAAGSDAAAACRDAGFVRLVATPDGDALAATGVLARALAAAGTPFQASVARDPVRAPDTEADATVTVGAPGGDAALATGPLSVAAFAAAQELAFGAGADAAEAADTDAIDPVLALAGTVAAEAVPGDEHAGLREALAAAGVERRPGVGVPTADLADGLAHSGLFHAPFSGDPEAARAELAALGVTDRGDDDRRRVASLVALSSVREGTPRAADAVGRALRPHVGGPFETVEGYADVLDAVARERPGTGVALALGYGDEGDSGDGESLRVAALAAWRDHGRRAHAALRAADTGRYDGVLVVRVPDGAVESPPLGTVARLARDYRSPEPVVLAVAGSEAAAAATDRDVTGPMRDAAAGTDAHASGRGSTAAATGITDENTFAAAFREALGR